MNALIQVAVSVAGVYLIDMYVLMWLVRGFVFVLA